MFTVYKFTTNDAQIQFFQFYPYSVALKINGLPETVNTIVGFSEADWGIHPKYNPKRPLISDKEVSDYRLADILASGDNEVDSIEGICGTSYWYHSKFKKKMIFDLFINRTIDINHRYTNGDTPAHIVAYHGDVGLLFLLDNMGADLRLKNELSHDCIAASIYRSNGCFSNLVGERDYSMETVDVKGKDIVAFVIDRNIHYEVKEFVECEATAIVNGVEYNMLEYAVKGNKLASAYTLLESGADPNTITIEGITILQFAEDNNLNKMYSLLKEYI